MMAILSWGMALTSSRMISTPSSPSSIWVILLEKSSRSTARESPAGTLVSLATFRMRESSLNNSSFKTPEAFSKDSDFSELLQTNSARKGERWAEE